MDKMSLIFNVALFIGLMALSKDCFAQATPMQLTSPAFKENQMIPSLYTCQGADISPALEVQNIPDGTRSLVLIVDDPDAPMGTWDHWIVYNIPPTQRVAQNSIPGTQVKNSFGKLDYGGPCPPSGTHRYFFKLYALDTLLTPAQASSKAVLEKEMGGHILREAQLIGLYKKK